jgi:hypothetical protein
MKTIKAIIAFFFCLSLFVGCCNCIRDYSKVPDEEKIKKFETLAKEGVKITATYATTYTETTIKIMKIPVKTYEMKYYFQVEGVSYSGTQKLNKLPKLPVVEAAYMPKNSSINSPDAKKEAEQVKETENSNFALWLGIILLGIGSLGIIGSYSIIQEEFNKDE